MKEVDPTFDGRLRQTYKKAMAKGLWKGTYVATDHNEYWAEGAQAYFDCMRPQFGANTREKLKAYDPDRGGHGRPTCIRRSDRAGWS